MHLDSKNCRSFLSLLFAAGDTKRYDNGKLARMKWSVLRSAIPQNAIPDPQDTLARFPSSRGSKTPVVRVSHASVSDAQALQERFDDECEAQVCRYTRRREGVIDYVVLYKDAGLVVLGAGYATEELIYVDEIVASISLVN